MNTAKVPERNQALVVNPRVAEKNTLEKMRKKLAVAQPLKEEAPIRIPLSLRSARLKRERLGQSLWAGAIALVALGMNVYALMHKNQILENIGIRQEQVLASPQANWSIDDQAWFWAYAAYDLKVFRERYSQGDALVDPDDAKHHLKILLAKTSESARSQILKLKKDR
jgi:hypothetical protein